MRFAMKNDSNLFFTCSLIEYIGRQQRLARGEVVKVLGQETVDRIYRHADVLHCEQIGKVADEFTALCGIPEGSYDNVAKCKYTVPDYWTIGEVYERLIEDVLPSEDRVTETLREVYESWISESISNYNSDFYYQSRDYIRECYLSGEVLD